MPSKSGWLNDWENERDTFINDRSPCDIDDWLKQVRKCRSECQAFNARGKCETCPLTDVEDTNATPNTAQ